MNIYEKIFARLEEINMSQIELARRTGIATSTISDWRKKQINPQADKLVAICKALDMSLVDLLCDEEDKKNEFSRADYVVGEQFIIDSIMMSSGEMKRRNENLLGNRRSWIYWIELHSLYVSQI